jgi:hypothetical protein
MVSPWNKMDFFALVGLLTSALDGQKTNKYPLKKGADYLDSHSNDIDFSSRRND